jgi:WD40 repeat protein
VRACGTQAFNLPADDISKLAITDDYVMVALATGTVLSVLDVDTATHCYARAPALNGHGNTITCIVFSVELNAAITGSEDGFVQILFVREQRDSELQVSYLCQIIVWL